jgi:hypothetical protein
VGKNFYKVQGLMFGTRGIPGAGYRLHSALKRTAGVNWQGRMHVSESSQDSHSQESYRLQRLQQLQDVKLYPNYVPLRVTTKSSEGKLVNCHGNRDG